MIPTRKELKLQEFADFVLNKLEKSEDWMVDAADILDDIGCLAIKMGLAKKDQNSLFKTL